MRWLQLIILGIGLLSSAEGQDYHFEKLTTRDGLSHSTVYALAQDHRGFIWIGAREGLNCYDSYGIKVHYAQEKTGLASNEISSLLAARKKLFVGTIAGLSVYDFEKDSFFSLLHEGESLGHIQDLYESLEGHIYICSTKGLYLLETGGKTKLLMEGVSVRSIVEYKRNVFWTALHRKIMLINESGELIKQYALPDSIQMETQAILYQFFKAGDGSIWLGSNRGLLRFSAEKDGFERVRLKHSDNPIEANLVRSVAEDDLGRLWIGTESGIFVFDKQTEVYQHYSQAFSDIPNALSDKAVYRIFKSREGIIWIGTYFGGVNYVKPKNRGFYKMIPDASRSSIGGKAVSQIIQDKQGKLWIGAEDGGVSIFEKEQGSFQYLQHQLDDPNSISCNNVHAIHQDRRGTVWIGTFLGGLNSYDPKTGVFRNYKKNTKDDRSISNNYVYAVYQDSRERLWAGTQAGLNIYDYQRDNFTHFRPEVFENAFIYDLLEDWRGDLWICTRYSGIYRYKSELDTLISYGKEQGLKSLEIISVHEDAQRQLWFGSLNGGLFKWDAPEGRFQNFSQEDGLPNNNVYGILDDEEGMLWVTTNKGLSKIDPATKKITTYDIAHGLPTNQFNFKSFFKDKEGWMYFGAVNGLCYFHPDSLNLHTEAPDVHFTDLKLFNKSLPIGEKSILKKHIDQTDRFTLRRRENVVTFEFVALNYFSPGNNRYSYFLEGFDQGWNEVGNKRTATYTNLSPGDYTFRLKAFNIENQEEASERNIQFTVTPPFWKTNWALGLYTILIGLLVFFYTRVLRFIHQQKMAVQLERIEKSKIKELNRHKLNFFTYISHEFKTPLTLIIASIDKFLGEKRQNLPGRNDLLVIRRNAGRLHSLVEQLMEFRKIETDHAALELSKGDLILFLKDTFSAFLPLFAKKHIHGQFTCSHAEYHVYFDADKLEKIITNLLSNAIKNTEEYGEIDMDVSIYKEGGLHKAYRLDITITDTGSGIREEEVEKLLKPFYQGASGKSELQGSGIGLTLVNSLINYLKGEFHIQKGPEKGAIFEISLPLYHQLQNEQSKIRNVRGNKDLIINQDLFYEEEAVGSSTEASGLPTKEFTLLIVEDNRELQKFLSNHFDRFYNVRTAINGAAALEKIKKHPPDLILSDVMTPKMDGVTLCARLKEDVQTSHIPLILLTAQSGRQRKLEGLNVGADAYLPKPFDLKELELTIKNLLEARNNIRRHFLQFGSLEVDNIPTNNKDQEFIRKIKTIVDKHFNNPHLTIALLAQEAGVSRSLLHIKLKKLVNLSASEFIKTIRLKQAAQLLKEGKKVSEVAYKVGFSDPNYFSRSFKKFYQIAPSEFRAHSEMED